MSKAKQIAEDFGAGMMDSATTRKSRVDAAHPSAPMDPRLKGITRAKNAALIEVGRIVRDERQPRQDFETEALQALADSLRDRGQLQPIRVRWDEGRGCYVIIAGERRWRAAKMAGMETIAAVIHDGEPSDAEARTLQLIENLIREDLSQMEQAQAFYDLMENEGWTEARLAKEVGVSQSTISKAMALLVMPTPIQESVERGELTASTAYELRQIPDPEQQIAVAQEVVANNLSRDQARRLLRERRGTSTAAAPRPPRQVEFRLRKYVIKVQGPVANEEELWATLQELVDTRGRVPAA